jgi:AcrR family transcriptional regulator
VSPRTIGQVEESVKPLRRDAAQNRDRLLRAAAKVFAEHGLDAGVEEVAREAGVGMGTLYRRFPTKDSLIAELVRELLHEVIALAREALAVPEGLGLEQFLYASAEAEAAQRGCLARLWSDPETLALKNECRAAIQQLLADAQRHRQVRADAEFGDISLLLHSLPGVIEASAGTGGAGLRRHIAILLAGLRPPSDGMPELPPTPAAGIRAEARDVG